MSLTLVDPMASRQLPLGSRGPWLESVKGGVHPRFGTRNVIFPSQNDKYLEVVEVLNHPASDKAPFGQAVRARSELGGGWMGWCVAVDDLAPFEERLGRSAVTGQPQVPGRPGTDLATDRHHGLIADPQVPYLLKWEGDPAPPVQRRLYSDVKMSSLTIAGLAERVTEWLGEPVEKPLEDVAVNWVAPHGAPGVPSVTFDTAREPSPSDALSALHFGRHRRGPMTSPADGGPNHF